MTCCMYGCKYLILQMVGFGEDIIWWSELYNIELWIMHCRVFTWKSMHAQSCWIFGEERNPWGLALVGEERNP